ncbi:DUF3231 family protein [Bacillus sp. DJP31]|uniref:DUF3231 family protein n=1 Tax=Bacillus sp. DJP31 TaxID=3409789 RepID=UPI003BB66E91
MEVHHDQVGLSTAEMSFLWSNYIGDTMLICVFEHFLRNVEDKDIESVLLHGLDLATKHAKEVKDIFIKENFPIPQGFGPQDVNLDAPRLFSDQFYLYYLRLAIRGGLANFSIAFSNSHRDDVRKYFMHCIHEDTELFNKTVDLMLEKGLTSRPPGIPVPKKIDFIHDKAFLGEWFGEDRPLTSIEISNIFSNIETNMLGSALLTAFSQTTEEKKLKNYFQDGINIAKNHIESLSKLMENDPLVLPQLWNPEISDCIKPVFSDKLMLQHNGHATTGGIGNYGIALASSQRRDIGAMYIKLTAESIMYGEKGARLAISFGWLEQPPLSIDRDELVKK